MTGIHSLLTADVSPAINAARKITEARSRSANKVREPEAESPEFS
jgi:hypothetical protein